MEGCCIKNLNSSTFCCYGVSTCNYRDNSILCQLKHIYFFVKKISDIKYFNLNEDDLIRTRDFLSC